MEKITVDTWLRLLGYNPNMELKKMILQAVEAEKISLAEVCGRYAMPPVLIGDEKNNEGYDNEFRPPIRIGRNII
jgi:hypothetical protein